MDSGSIMDSTLIKISGFFLGKARFQSFPLLYHGIGAYAPEKHVARIRWQFHLF